MAQTTWSGMVSGALSVLMTVAFGLIPVAVAGISSWFDMKSDLSIGVSWIYLTIVLIFCALIPLIPRGRLEPKGKAVLITGCDSGFGFLLAKQLDALGMHVFAGCYLKDKGGEGSKKLEETTSNRLKVVQLDVTSDESVKNVVDFIEAHLPRGQKGLWGVINNAGTSAFGEVECSSMALYKHVAEVNLWGVIRVTKACLPMIRRSQGRVVNMTSGLCRMAAPSRSVYSLSKSAVNCFSTCLRYEMKGWGVKVSVIEPGNYIAGTNIFTKQSISSLAEKMWKEMDDVVKADYGKEYFDEKTLEMIGYCNNGERDLTPVTDAYEDALLSRHPLQRYNPMTAYWKIRLFIMVHLPSWIGDNLYIYKRGKTDPPKKLD